MTHYIYFNYYSIGYLINLLFFGIVALYTLTLPKKSKATLHLGLAYLLAGISGLAYFYSASFYHIGAAFHRYITVIVVIGTLIHTCQFLFHFPENRYPRISKTFLITMWAIVLLLEVIFIKKSITADYMYHLEGQYWDFKLDDFSQIIGLVVILYMIIEIILALWKVFEIKGKERWTAVGIFLSLFIFSFVTSTTNYLSRAGAIKRELFFIIQVFFSMVGFFFLAILYLNKTKDRTTFMAKIIGISLITFLVLFLGLSYYTSNIIEKSYDTSHQQQVPHILFDENFRPPDIDYITVYSMNKNNFNTLYQKDNIAMDFILLKDEFLNAAIWKKIQHIKNNNLNSGIKSILEQSHPEFLGYKLAIEEYLKSISSEDFKSVNQIFTYLSGIQRTIRFNYNKINTLPNDKFRESLTAFLKNQKGNTFQSFKKTILIHLGKSRSQGSILKKEVLDYLAPIDPPETRHYREDKNKEHYLSFMQVDIDKNNIYEIGFSYIAYRKFIHPDSLLLILSIIGVVLFIVIGFRIFFLGTLINPLKSLLNGLRQVEEGNLKTEIPIKVEDEIGFISRNFNSMVKQIDNYTNNLEVMVKDRTNEVQVAMEELEATNEQLIIARDALWGEMELAKKIQTVLLPKKPEIKGYEISAFMKPATEVGGDYYDIINVGDRDWVVIGDVSGHGVPAGLIMMMVQTSINVTLIRNPDIPPYELLITINQTIAKNITQLNEDKYMTITVLASYKDGKFYFSGLHQDIMIYRAKSKNVELVGTNGMWIGLMDDITGMVEDNILTLNIGDTILLYTDGITEALKNDNKNDMYSGKKLQDVFYNLGSKSTSDIKDGILDSLKEYTCVDDVTLVVLKRLE